MEGYKEDDALVVTSASLSDNAIAKNRTFVTMFFYVENKLNNYCTTIPFAISSSSFAAMSLLGTTVFFIY